MRTGPPWGIPIPEEIHNQYPDEIKKAWETFDDWWQQNRDGLTPISRSSMPPEVADAFQKIKKAPIPGYENATGEDSCYVNGVQMNMVD